MQTTIISELNDIVKQDNGVLSILAKYLIEKENVAHLKIVTIVEECYVSAPTATRLAQKLGFSGFPEFKFYLELEKNTTKIPMHKEIVSTDYIHNVNEALVSTFSRICEEDILSIVNLMYEKKKIRCFSMGGTNIITQDFIYKLRRLDKDAYINSDYHIQYVEAINLNDDSLVFAISYSGITKEVIKLIDISLEKGATVIIITSNRSLKYDLEHVFIIYINSQELYSRNYSILSRMAMIGVLDYIYLKYLYHKIELNTKILEKTTLLR